MESQEATSLDELRQRLFTGPHRLGWEYRPPPAARSSPLRDHEPVWTPPAGLDHNAATRAGAGTPRTLGCLTVMFAVTTVVMVVTVVVGYDALTADSESPLAALTAFIVVLGWPVPLLLIAFAVAWWVIRRSDARHRRRLHEAWQGHLQDRHRWGADVRAFEDEEEARVRTVPLWYPIDVSLNARVDVVGGTPAGWAALLTTWGTSGLGEGRSVAVLDCSRENVASQLTAAASDEGLPVRDVVLPSDTTASSLLAGMSSGAVAEVLAATAGTFVDDRKQHRQLSMAHLARAIVARLDPPVTLVRLKAAIDVVQQNTSSGLCPALAASEVGRLADFVDDARTGGAAGEDLHLLQVSVDALTDGAGTDGVAPPDIELGRQPRTMPWERHGVTVLRASPATWSRQRIVHRFLARALIQRLEDGHVGQNPDRSLALIGADELDRETLEILLSRCRERGVQCMVALQRLHHDAGSLMGDADSMVFMRMGNGPEAAAAAEFIGRGHQLTLTSVSTQQGETVTRSENQSFATSESNVPAGWFAWQRSWARTTGTGTSQAQNTGTSTVWSRTYDFQVEPTALQSLAHTAFIWVSSSAGWRVVMSGTCDPLLVAVDRVALSRSRVNERLAITS